MAALTITAANLVMVSGNKKQGIAGATITAGMPLYKDTAAADVLKPADVNLSLLGATVEGISLHAALTGQPISYITDGVLGFGAILTKGTIYVAGAGVAGDIDPAADLTAGWYTSILGVALTTSNLQVRINNSGVTP